MARQRGETRTLADFALAELRDEILSGELAPGTPIRLQRYVDSLSMSAVPIREALRFLEQQGLVERRPHQGVFVAPMSPEDLEDTYRVRLEIESIAVRQAAHKMTPAGRDHIYDLLETYTVASKTTQGAAWDAHSDLHMGMYDLAESKWLALVVPMLWDNGERYRRLSLPMRGSPEERLHEHEAIVEAVAAGNPDEAEKHLRTHLTQSFEAAILTLREHDEDGDRSGTKSEAALDSV